MTRLPRAIRVALLILLGLVSAELASSREPAQLFDTPPFAIIRANSGNALARLLAAPQVAMPLKMLSAEDWRHIPAIGCFDRSALLTNLPKLGAIHASLLAHQGELRFLLALDMRTTKREAIRTQLRNLGLRPDSGLSLWISGSVLYLSDSKSLLNAIAARLEMKADSPEKVWRADMNDALTGGGIRAWIPVRRLEALLALVAGIDAEGMMRSGPLDYRAGIRLAIEAKDGWTFDLGLPLWISPTRQDRLKADSAADSVTPLPVFPNEMALTVDTDRFRETCLLFADPDQPLWRGGLDLFAMGMPYQAYLVEMVAHDLRIISGLHPSRDLLTQLHGVTQLGFHAGTIRGLFHVREPKRFGQDLRRLLAWTEFLKTKSPITVESTPTRWTVRAQKSAVGEVTLKGDAVSFRFGDNLKTKLSASPSVSPRAHQDKPIPLLRWRFEFRPQTLAANLNLEEGLAIAALIAPEEGRLERRGTRLHVVLSGTRTPVAHLAGGLMLNHLIERRSDALQTWQAEMIMSEILYLQQIYRHLDLGRYNGHPGAFAPSLAALVDGRSEYGKPLSRMVGALYGGAVDDPEPFFVRMIRSLHQGRTLYGYHFCLPLAREGTPLDPKTEWFLLALPESGSDLALLMDQDAHLYRRRLKSPDEAADCLTLPADLNKSGWKRVE